MNSPSINKITSTAYYNDFDAGAVAWLRELIKAGLIAPGEVDNRSITDVQPDDLKGFTQCHFFAGIGGWSYALRLAGWPDDKPVWTGSPPCQPFSAAGKLKGKNDVRHLAPHFVNLVRADSPPVLFGEQVASAEVFGSPAKASGIGNAKPPQWAWIDDLSDRLEAAHYTVGAVDFPSASVGAPHIRQRTFFGAVCSGADTGGQKGRMADTRSVYKRGAKFRAGICDETGSNSVFPSINGAICRMGDLHSKGLEGYRQHVRDGGKPGRVNKKANGHTRPAITPNNQCSRPCTSNGFWSDADWIFCRDGVWRPVEPGTRPLVDGLPHRMGLLRGYGNAINPQAAKVFIQAFTAAAGA